MDGLEGLGLLLASNCVAEDKEVILQRTSDLRFTHLSFFFPSLSSGSRMDRFGTSHFVIYKRLSSL